MINKLLVVVTVVVLAVSAFGIVAYMQPNDYSISRTININAPAAEIFPHVNKLPNWHAWSPWVDLDPNAKVTFAGPEEGVGSSMTWDGNDKMGKGSLTILESKPFELVRYRLDFIKPMMDSSMSKFEFKSTEANETAVVWTMYGEHPNFLSKATWMVFCSQMIGKDFEKGLANLKAVVEAGSNNPPSLDRKHQ